MLTHNPLTHNRLTKNILNPVIDLYKTPNLHTRRILSRFMCQASTMLSQIEEGFVKRRSKRRVKDLSDAPWTMAAWLVLLGFLKVVVW